MLANFHKLISFMYFRCLKALALGRFILGVESPKEATLKRDSQQVVGLGLASA